MLVHSFSHQISIPWQYSCCCFQAAQIISETLCGCNGFESMAGIEDIKTLFLDSIATYFAINYHRNIRSITYIGI